MPKSVPDSLRNRVRGSNRPGIELLYRRLSTDNRGRSVDESNGNAIKRLPFRRLRQIISAGALLLTAVHLIWPNLGIDPTTIALLFIVVLPWLAPLIKSLELPGGWKIEFQTLQEAASRADAAGLLAAQPSVKKAAYSFQSVAAQDPNLALAGLRIEIEQRLSRLAEASGVKTPRPAGIGQLLRALVQNNVLTSEERSILADMTITLNYAVHGATVDVRTSDWAITYGPRLLASLDERIDEANSLRKPKRTPPKAH